MQADISSSLGMLNSFKRATLVFLQLSLETMLVSVAQTRYIIAQYAFLLASPNPCKEQEAIVYACLSYKHLGKEILVTSCKSEICFSKVNFCPVGISLSQPIFKVQSF